MLNKKEETKVEEVVKENVAETSTKDDNFMDRMMAEYEEDSKATENWDRSEACKREMAEKESMNMFTDNVSESKEFSAINELRKAAGKDPIEVNEQFEKFLGKDSESKSMKESLDNIAENIKKDPEFKNKILGILQE